MAAVCQAGGSVSPINLLPPRLGYQGGGWASWGHEGKGKGGGAGHPLTRLLELTSSWQQVQQHRQAIPQTLRALWRGEAFSGVGGEKSRTPGGSRGYGHRPRAI